MCMLWLYSRDPTKITRICAQPRLQRAGMKNKTDQLRARIKIIKEHRQKNQSLLLPPSVLCPFPCSPQRPRLPCIWIVHRSHTLENQIEYNHDNNALNTEGGCCTDTSWRGELRRLLEAPRAPTRREALAIYSSMRTRREAM